MIRYQLMKIILLAAGLKAKRGVSVMEVLRFLVNPGTAWPLPGEPGSYWVNKSTSYQVGSNSVLHVPEKYALLLLWTSRFLSNSSIDQVLTSWLQLNFYSLLLWKENSNYYLYLVLGCVLNIDKNAVDINIIKYINSKTFFQSSIQTFI